MPLRAKSAYANAEVAAVWRDIESHVSADEAWEAIELAVREVKLVIGQQVHRVVYGWSGGKDSQALRVVMERAGISRAVMGCVPKLEFHCFLDWVADHAPAGLVRIGNEDLDLPWLAAHEQYLFPRTSRLGYFWTLNGTRRAQHIYQERYNPALQIYGRRTLDGNPVGKDGILRSQRLVAYSPLRDWTHEMVLAVIHYTNSPMCPSYLWPHGFTAGTGPWPGRRVGDLDESWAETYEIEPDRVIEAARHIDSAREWLARR